MSEDLSKNPSRFGTLTLSVYLLYFVCCIVTDMSVSTNDNLHINH